MKFTLRTIRSPFILERIVCIREEDAKLEIHQKITNVGTVEQEFMWGHHPAFGWPFIDKDTYLSLAGTPKVTVLQGSQNSPFSTPKTGIWPVLTGDKGQVVDMSRAYTHEDKIYMEYGISELQEGCYELRNKALGLGIRMHWDLSVFPYLWIWGMYCGHEGYPWFGRAYTMAVELWSSMPGDFKKASAEAKILKLGAGKSMKTEVTAEIFAFSSEKSLK